MMLDKEKAGVAAPAQISRDENADGGSEVVPENWTGC
jgi:hypothetical protein